MEDPKDTIIDDSMTEEDGAASPDPEETIIDGAKPEEAPAEDPKETTMETLRDDTVEAMGAAAKLMPKSETPEEPKDTIVESSEDPEDEEGDEADDLKQTMMPTSRDHVDAMQKALEHDPKEDNDDGDK